ncbi:uncharacterized protein FOBCDRAFT_264234 [Fusarium oxysporum Fo47]|uniref:uncharacterized protein n=1 Tax=Fusarium oxysporum Fo47 TaxID=660027 RepID=UPI002869E499|nr:uncharacterized protein FOBCDRAFT_264234 [Fusarium oxysporum Fo47]WJG36133.1 hypothetical protein FOBCDRAFT_264234 [Fusarium oxysporum Fo47]
MATSFQAVITTTWTSTAKAACMLTGILDSIEKPEFKVGSACHEVAIDDDSQRQTRRASQVTNLSNRAFVLTQLVSENFSSHFLNADIHYVRMCVMSNENLEKAGFHAKTAEPRITGPLPHWYCTVLREVMITIGGVAAAKILSSRLFWRA